MTADSKESLIPELLTIPQVAKFLKVCRAHVYTLIADGLPIIRLGRLVRIQRQSLTRWLDDREQAERVKG